MEAAASHTGKIASEYAVYQDLLAEAGVIQLTSLTELIAAGEVLSVAPLPRDLADHAPERMNSPGAGSDGVAVFSIPGGTRALTADLCETHHVPLSVFHRSTVSQLTAALPDFGGVENPTDLTGQVLSHLGLFDQTLSIIARDPHTEALIVQVANRGPRDVMERLDLLGRVARETKVPVIVTFLGDSVPPEARAELRALGILCARDPAEAALYLGWLYAARRAARAAQVAVQTQPSVPLKAPQAWPQMMDWLGRSGIAVPGWVTLGANDDVNAACAGLTGPLAVKALPEDAEHKTENNLLALNVAPAGVDAEAGRIRSRMDKPEAQVLVQEMVSEGVEVLLAATRNADFGPVLAIGLGGVAVELFKDVAWLALPTDAARVRAAITRLKLSAVLQGFRGKPAADIDALIAAAVQFGDAFVSTVPQLQEVEVNPLLVLPAGRGVVAVDALFKARGATEVSQP